MITELSSARHLISSPLTFPLLPQWYRRAERYLEGILFGLTALDLATFVAVAILFAAVASIAAFIPARRATKVDPMVALRCE